MAGECDLTTVGLPTTPDRIRSRASSDVGDVSELRGHREQPILARRNIEHQARRREVQGEWLLAQNIEAWLEAVDGYRGCGAGGVRRSRAQPAIARDSWDWILRPPW